MYKFYIGGVLLPVTPGAVTLKTNNKDETVDLINGGTYTVLNPPGLSEWEFEFRLPATQLPVAQYENGFKDPQYYINHLEGLKGNCEPFRFIIVRSSSRDKDNLNAYADTNVEVSLADLTITEDAEEYGFGKHGKITLKQYEHHETERYSISESGSGTTVTIDDSIPRYAIVKDGTYISREGDTLRSIAFDKLGDEKYAEALAAYQKPPLEFTLDPLPEFTILQIDTEAIKAKYEEITLSTGINAIWELTTYTDGVTSGVIDESAYELYKGMMESVCEVKYVKPSAWQRWKDAFMNRTDENLADYLTNPNKKYVAPLKDQPPLIHLGTYIEALIEYYGEAQLKDRDDELNQLVADRNEVSEELAKVTAAIADVNTQIEALDDAVVEEGDTTNDAVRDALLNTLPTLEAEEARLEKEKDDLLNRYAGLMVTPFNAIELTLSDAETKAFTEALNRVKADAVSASVLAGWVQEIGLLEDE